MVDDAKTRKDAAAPVARESWGWTCRQPAAGIAVMDVEPHKLKVVDLRLFKP